MALSKLEKGLIAATVATTLVGGGIGFAASRATSESPAANAAAGQGAQKNQQAGGPATTPTPTIGGPDGSGFKIITDYQIDPANPNKCIDVDLAKMGLPADTVTLLEGDWKIGPLGTPQSQMTQVYDSDQNTGLIVEETGSFSACAPWGGDAQVVGTDLATISFVEGQDVEGFKNHGCGLPQGCDVVDIIKATNGVPAQIQK